MKTRSGLLTAAVCAVVIAVAALIWHHLPTPTDLYGPFEVRGTAGEPVRGRTVTATVTSIRIAPEVNSVQAAGEWVVVDATLEATDATALPRADLIVGPNSYTASDRFFGKTLIAEISPGIPQRGSWVFDVAAPLVADDATDALTLRVWTGSEILDSRLVIETPAGDPHITRIADAEVTAPEIGVR